MSVPTQPNGSSWRGKTRAKSPRDLLASDLSWRPLDMVQGQTLRWLVEGFRQDWKS